MSVSRFNACGELSSCGPWPPWGLGPWGLWATTCGPLITKVTKQVAKRADVIAEGAVVNRYKLEWRFDLKRSQLYALVYQSDCTPILDLKQEASKLSRQKKAKPTASEAAEPERAAVAPEADSESDDGGDQVRAEVFATVKKVKQRLEAFKARQAHLGRVSVPSESSSSSSSSSSGPAAATGSARGSSSSGVPDEFSADAAGLQSLARQIAAEPALVSAISAGRDDEDDLLQGIAEALVAVEECGPADEAHDWFEQWQEEDQNEIGTLTWEQRDSSAALNLEVWTEGWARDGLDSLEPQILELHRTSHHGPSEVCWTIGRFIGFIGRSL